ncbi:MAG: CPBP family intramembrane metalloprotease [Propionibacteriaceae bacterium]|jgi:membrane protease YdiL (CAAX protease family)|nr:CPBP family intramembrane metalloprotease [Propionibacteriaceae bacterium]
MANGDEGQTPSETKQSYGFIKDDISNGKRVSIIYFTLGTFLLSYSLWAIVILGQRLGWFAADNPWAMLSYILGGNIPPIVAYLTFKRADPGFTLKKYLKNAFDFKQKPLYYGLTALLVAVYFIVPALMGGLSTEAAQGLEARGVSDHIPLYLTLLGIPIFFFGGGSEELGWRGLLQPELEKRMHFIPATIITGTIWTLWHLPLWFIPSTGQSEINFGFFFIMVMGLSFGLATIRRLSGSVLLCVLFHCAVNSLNGTWPIKDELPIKIVTTLVYIALAVTIVYWQEKKKKALPTPELSGPAHNAGSLR